jgi:hypothetical protein
MGLCLCLLADLVLLLASLAFREYSSLDCIYCVRLVPCCSPFLCVTVVRLRGSPCFIWLASLGLVRRTFARSVVAITLLGSTGCTLGERVLQAAQACKTSFTFLLERCSLLEKINRFHDDDGTSFSFIRFRLIVAPVELRSSSLLVVDRRGDDGRRLVVLVGFVAVAAVLRSLCSRCLSCGRN